MLTALLPRLRILLITFWAGSLWTVGYVVAPVLFSTLADRTLAGTLAGAVFRTQAWISLVCGVVLLAFMWTDKENPSRSLLIKCVISMLACTVIGYFGLQPYMAELRTIAAQSGGIMDDAMRARFGWLHGAASVIYLVQSLLAVALVVKSR
ncbi:MAG: DUF4149 domain-containing protein [Oxalobacteraceae bacterium]|nr:DUF4149 domain-containing protein [Oxalobacteraceae bacterium]